MKLLPTALLAALAATSFLVVISVENHTDACARATAIRASNLQSRENPFDRALTEAGFPNPTKRAVLVTNIDETLNAFPGTDPCGTMLTGMELLNSILAGIIVFAAIFFPPAILRGIFHRGKV